MGRSGGYVEEEVSLIRGVASCFAVSLAVTCRIVFIPLHAPLFCRIFIFFNSLVNILVIRI